METTTQVTRATQATQATASAPRTHLPGLARTMVERGLVAESVAWQIMHNATRAQCSFYRQAMAEKAVDETAVSALASTQFGLPLIALEAVKNELSPHQLLPPHFIQQQQVLPLYRYGEKLLVAVGDPDSHSLLSEIAFATGLAVSAVLAEPTQLARAVAQLYEANDLANADANADDLLALEQSEALDSTDADAPLNIDTPIVRFVNKILHDAIRRHASDIHIEPYETYTRIRFRIDGVLHDTRNPPRGSVHKMVARIKILAQLDIAERRLPQDGRMQLAVAGNRHIDFRVSTMPTLFGEKIVIRILDTVAVDLNLDTLGFATAQLALYRAAIQQPHGMILVTGPTGSGKTVTLYSALQVLNATARNICSIEDPVEIYVDGINQININPKQGLTFSTVLRALLRQDPDVLMVGEIRDLETAEIAVKAAQTGHLVLSTLHTNDAISALTRLLNMGVATFNVAASVTAVVAQRLVRRLCEECRQPRTYPSAVLQPFGFTAEQIPRLELFEAIGCAACTDGYRGRSGIFEVLSMTAPLAEWVFTHGAGQPLPTAARPDHTLHHAALTRAMAGETTLAEVARVTRITAVDLSAGDRSRLLAPPIADA